MKKRMSSFDMGYLGITMTVLILGLIAIIYFNFGDGREFKENALPDLLIEQAYEYIDAYDNSYAIWEKNRYSNPELAKEAAQNANKTALLYNDFMYSKSKYMGDIPEDLQRTLTAIKPD